MQPHSEYRRALLNPAYDAGSKLLEERRTALYFAKPYGKRISEYEQVLLYAQPNPDWIAGGLGQGFWGTAFPGGRGAWENYFTEAKTSDWYAFRDPEGRWQRPYVAEKADGWREFQRLVGAEPSLVQKADFDARWGELVAQHLGALGLHDYGAFMALALPIRDALSDTLRAALVTSALDYLDNAQMIQAEKIYLAQILDGLTADVAPSQATWAAPHTWAGARRFIEELWGKTYDHIEIVFALHAIHEPLFGALVRSEFFTQHAPHHGDTFTLRVLWGSARAAQAAGTWSRELFARTLLGDPEFGDYNRKLLRYWAEKWLPLELRALHDARGLWEVEQDIDPCRELGPSYDVALQRVLERWLDSTGRLFWPELDVKALIQSIDTSKRT
ncbi:MAG TPA: hypothetical protein VK524_14365 [Polyangiaceae bacterium]|nr:hypothetical protein [Polyangiaceae bacterium]